MSTAKFDTLSNLAGTQTVPVATVAQGSAKAWVNFNGTGTVAIRAAFNVSSITDLGVGVYRVNFTTAMPDANYAVCAEDYYYASGSVTQSGVGNQLASYVEMYYMTFNASAFYDTAIAYVVIFD
jgi:hypothetical protein